MTININAAALKAALNNANPQVVGDMLKSMAFGDFVRAMPVPRNGITPAAAAANPYVLAAAQSLTLPDDAKAQTILLAYARAGSGTVGVMTVDAGGDAFSGSVPATRHIAISPSGDILFLAADAWTSVDIFYQPWKVVTQEVTLAVASNALVFPTALGPVQLIMEVEALVGTSVGKKIIDVQGTAPAAGHAALNAAKTQVTFQATDAVTQARVKFGTYPTTDLDALLTAVSNLIS